MDGRKSWQGRAALAAAVSVIALISASGAVRAQDAAPVPVRYGAHPTYDRLVFDFPAVVDYQVDQQGNTATITFAQSASFDPAQLAHVGAAAVSREGTSTKITLQMPDGIRLRHFRSGSRVVMDFSRSDTPPPSPPATQSAAAAPAPAVNPARPWERLPLSSGAAPAPVPAPAPAAAPTSATALAPPSQTAARPADATTPPWLQGAPSQAAQAPAAPVPPSAAGTAPAASRAASRAAAASSPPLEPLPTEAQALEQVRTQAQELATAPPVQLVPAPSGAPAAPRAAAAPAGSEAARPAADAAASPARSATTPDAKPSDAKPAAPPERSQAFLEAQAKRNAQRLAASDLRSLGPPVPVVRSEGQGLRFKWPDPVTAAAFTRGPYVYLIFNKRAPLDLAALRDPPADDLVGGVTTIPSEGAAVRLAPPPGTFFAMRAEGPEWVVEMTRRPRTPDVPVPITTRNESDPATARVMVGIRGGEAVLKFQDPEVGDDLRIVPTAVAGEGIEDERDFPQFNILASAQGLVVKPEADGLIVRSLGQMVEIYAPSGTLLSLPDDAPGKVDTESDEGQPRLFNFTDWLRDDGRTYLERLRDLESRAASLPANERNPARLALARFQFANGNAVEADGILETMAQLQPALVNTRLFHALKGAAALTAGNLEEAAVHLRHASLDREPEIAMWRAALAMAEGNPRSAAEQISRGPDLTRRYPPPFANRLGLSIAEVLINIGDIPAARDRLEAILANDPTLGEEGQARYLRGRLSMIEGRPDDAIATWSALERGPPSPARVFATLALVDFQLKDNRITAAEATQRVEQLRYTWRGDALEFAVLRRLGELELATGEVRSGLERLRDLIALNPQSREVSAVTRQMSSAFQKFFLEGEADKLTPIAAIGLFNEFRNLVPEGQAGDKMMRNLADRLIKVDLLDQAADLLGYQIKNRLEGEAKAESGARLAFTLLLDNKPEAALAALKDTELPDLPIDLVRDRNRLASRGLADLDRPADALKQIAEDLSLDADVLRSEINWKAGKWAAAAEWMGRLAGDPPVGDEQMPDENARWVLRYCAALALAGDQAGLDVARAKYGPAMSRGTYKDIFTVMASDRAGPMTDVRDVQARLKSTAPFDTFLAAYRQRLVNPAPGATTGG